MIRLLYEDEATPLDVPSIYGGDFHKDIKLYDVVKCAGYDWFIIDIKDDVVTLLAMDNDFDKYTVFGKSMFFDVGSNRYKTSKIRKFLNNRVLPELQSANPIPTRLYDVDCTDKVWLLSVDEAKKLPKDIRSFSDFWWLRTPGSDDIFVAGVFADGSIDDIGNSVYHDFNVAVRPAMRVRIEDLD